MPQVLDQIARHLDDELAALGHFDALERYSQSSALIDYAVDQMQAWLLHHEFPTEAEEIRFFKVTRPAVLARKIEEGLRYNLTINQPIGTAGVQIRYLEEAIRGLQSFFRLNAFYYQYYKNHFTELDTLYFKRNAGHLQVPLPEITVSDTRYATAVSDLFAKFIGYEHIQQFVLEQINKLTENGSRPYGTPERVRLKWTGELVNVVELAYGIWLTGQLNDGNASLNQIVRWLEGSLDISLGVIQRKFTEIQQRKRYSITKYLDRMKKAIIQKIEEGNQ